MSHSFSQISVEVLNPHRVICARVISAQPENDSIQLVKNWLVEHSMDPANCRSFGFDVMISPAEAEAGLRGYEVGFTVPIKVMGDNLLKIRTYGGGTYAVLRVKNAFEAPFESIPAGWGILMKWIENNPEWQPAWHICYEEIVKGDVGEDLILYQPVQKR